MDVYDKIEEITKRRAPQTSEEKRDLGLEMVELFNYARYNSEVFKWVESAALYYIDKYNLHNHIYGNVEHKKYFYDELGIPDSTARNRISMWKFYVVGSGMKLKSLRDCDLHKLSRALAYLRDKNHDEIKRIIEMSKRGKVSRADFLREIKAIN